MSIDDKKRKTYGDSRAAGKNKHSKVTRIRLPENCSDDPAVDDFLLESLQEEAEEMEKKIAQDPAIANITAPDDMFASIVRRLKAEGIWDESDALSAEAKADTPKDTANAAAEGKRADITAAAEEGKKADAASAVAEDKRADITAAAEEGKMADAVNAAVEGGAETAVSEPAAEERKEGCAARYTAETPAHDAEVFGQTPLRDTQNRTPNRERKVRKRFGILKGIAGVAAIFVLVFGLSMTSGANRRLFVQMWDAVTDNFNVRTATNYVGEDDYIRSVSSEESDAWKEIQDKTGIPAIELLYVPDGMEYLGYEI